MMQKPQMNTEFSCKTNVVKDGLVRGDVTISWPALKANSFEGETAIERMARFIQIGDTRGFKVSILPDTDPRKAGWVEISRQGPSKIGALLSIDGSLSENPVDPGDNRLLVSILAPCSMGWGNGDANVNPERIIRLCRNIMSSMSAFDMEPVFRGMKTERLSRDIPNNTVSINNEVLQAYKGITDTPTASDAIAYFINHSNHGVIAHPSTSGNSILLFKSKTGDQENSAANLGLAIKPLSGWPRLITREEDNTCKVTSFNIKGYCKEAIDFMRETLGEKSEPTTPAPQKKAENPAP